MRLTFVCWKIFTQSFNIALSVLHHQLLELKGCLILRTLWLLNGAFSLNAAAVPQESVPNSFTGQH